MYNSALLNNDRIISDRNLGFAHILERTLLVGKHDLPAMPNTASVLPDYIALSSQPGEFKHSPLTGIGWWEDDYRFDGARGIFEAIRRNDEKLQKRWIDKLKGANFIFTPDYSCSSDVSDIVEHYQQYISRVVGLWLLFEIGAMPIPTIFASSARRLESMLDGFESTEVVAFSTKGYLRKPEEMDNLKDMVHLTVDSLDSLKAIVVYDTSSTNSVVTELFSYASEKGIKVLTPDNRLRVLHQQEAEL